MKKLLAAFCTFDLSASSNHMVLIPEGIFRGIDGRPTDAPHWQLTPERGRQIAAALNQRSIDMVIDYEHATLKAQENGEPAPAAGWLKAASFTYVDGVGLCNTQFEWLDKAKGFIESGEYKYLSPVFLYSHDGDVLALLNVALTNTPALDQLPEAKLAAAAQHYLTQNSTQQQDSTMEELLEQLRWMLNLPLSATAEEISAELSKLQQQISEKTGVSVAANSQNLFDAVQAVEQLKVAALSQQPDPTKFVPLSVYQEAVAKAGNADAAMKAKQIDDLIVAARSDGRLTGEVTVQWLKDQAQINPDFVKAHIQSLPKIAALTQRQTEQVGLAALHQQAAQHTPEALEVARQMGIDLGAPI